MMKGHNFGICKKCNKIHKHPMEGREHSKESKEKMSKAKIGKSTWLKGLTKETDERVAKFSERMKGISKPREQVEKMIASKKGKRMGKESSFYGRHHTEKNKRLFSEQKKGKNHPNYGKPRPQSVKDKISKAGKGIKKPPLTESHKNAIREANIREWSDPEKRDKRRRNIMKSLAKSPTKPESKFIEIVKKYNLPFKYNSKDVDIIIGGRVPDFYNCNGKKQVIEIFGEVYHDPDKAYFEVDPKRTKEGTIKHYKELSFCCLVIWEKEFQEEDTIVEKVKQFMETAIHA